MSTELPPVIAIDGPSGSGKGTVASGAAEALGWHLLDSGALYRILAHVSQQAGVSADTPARLEALARGLRVDFVRTSTGAEQILLDGRDVTTVVRSEESGKRASELAVIPQVRQGLVGVQRSFRRTPGLVADGRDMGTVIFPDAGLKIFLTASVEERVQRRYNQLKQKGLNATLPALFRDLIARDERDRNRAVSPLKAAPDAVVLDTTGMPVAAVVDQVLDRARRRYGEAAAGRRQGG
ncbi:MAG: (d)CMP kinase [Gammaproteobacteria bacterium]|nr:(d)CMP kinase [Gammaproteobacteria bacterium]MDE1887592.1 (d)CMP kinase [Gammaproteobacteria bacterium]MDE2022801.1 (d)CMP kinase [Gammaproteobacteria bacterium]MDE2273172.1 (d)CMP kinase [Gammaproteobacteria bacterium]